MKKDARNQVPKQTQQKSTNSTNPQRKSTEKLTFKTRNQQNDPKMTQKKPGGSSQFFQILEGRVIEPKTVDFLLKSQLQGVF